MKVLIYSARPFEIPYLKQANTTPHQIDFLNDALNSRTAPKANGYDAISIFSGDEACFITLEKLKDCGIKYISLRSVGYDNVNLRAAERVDIRVANVPAYSPYAIAEHAVALLLNLNRKLIESNNRVKRFNFDIDGLMGMDLYNKTVGIVGTGRIGSVMTKIMAGFGCKLLGYDLKANDTLISQYNMKYINLTQLCEQSDIISLHVPLNEDTHYLIDETCFYQMKNNVILINTARGAVINTKHLIDALWHKRIAAYGADVFENEKGLFFKDWSNNIPDDQDLIQLNAFPNVLLTGHHAPLTHEAMTNIAETTMRNLDAWATDGTCKNEVTT
jgi:D-lactate dehydrogenase